MRIPDRPYIRFAAIILIAAFADCLVVLFARRPLPWAALIPACIPLLVCVFVVIPMLKQKNKSQPEE